MYLITGATGNVGSALVTQLHEHGHALRAFVRDPSRADRFPDGVEIAVGDLDDLESITAAARGAEGVFYMQLNPGTAQTETIVTAARAAGVRKIVALSSIGAVLEPVNHPIGADLAAREAVLRESGLDVTYLRPNAFMSNALWWLPMIREGWVLDATEPGRVAYVDPDDIARVAAVALTQDGHAGHGFILTGPEALTAREQVEIIADVLGRHIEFVPATPDQLARDSVEHGMPAERADAIRQLNELFRAGRAGVRTDDVENITGTAPATFRTWCERNADAFRNVPTDRAAA
jgi:uncharacterized protein YbjT (DUF2867 family)